MMLMFEKRFFFFFFRFCSVSLEKEGGLNSSISNRLYRVAPKVIGWFCIQERKKRKFYIEKKRLSYKSGGVLANRSVRG